LRQRIAFTKEGLIVPKSVWSTEETLIPYRTIRDLKEFPEPPDPLVIIRHEGGEYTLRFDMVADERASAEIVQNLALLVQSAKAGVAPEAMRPKHD
jgi:hypothetical protein